MGVRPEGWLLDGGLTLPVRHIERIPTEQAAFIHGSLGECSITALAPLEHPQADQVQIRPDWEQVYFFSAEDETPLFTPGVPELF